MADTDDAHTFPALREYLGRARWFGGKGRSFDVTRVQRLGVVGPADATEPRVVVQLVEVTYDEPGGPETELYQVPLALYRDPQERLDHASVGRWEDPELGDVIAYDAPSDREAMARYLASFGGADHDGALAFRLVEGSELDLTAPGTLFSGEQSNSSILFGEDAVMKIFRKLTPGENPDITTHQVLTEAGSTHVAHLYGWIESGDLHLAMLQQFLRTASDGWDLALASVRDLFAEADLHAEEVGGDFAGESARLGEALREVHEQLRASFPTATIGAGDVADTMTRRLHEAIEIVPDLEQYADGARAVFDAMRGLGEIPVQRVHGDLHLGQTLRTVAGWKLVDFEGEPAKPLAERLLPDSPWRDVAGMTRSFDYAPHAVAESMPEDDEDVIHQRAHRADEWARRNRKAFLASYCGEGGLTDEDRTLLTAYVLDKAVYECVYEARNRPTWLPIPLAAFGRLTES
ncbi:maltokinase N-terminal cap-like domain-containing protein [Nocardioides sp. SYSU DS0651]|uniref:maltokinase N-terminal cap-like domain-containing protein n=1 Tax=Nocardioides sp. SYSU DS0651 TaxID=3415955 RepID=UPI003F4BDE6F